MNLKKRFLRVYYKLPRGEEKETIVVIDGKPCSWNVVKQEVEHSTAVGVDCLEKLVKMGII